MRFAEKIDGEAGASGSRDATGGANGSGVCNGSRPVSAAAFLRAGYLGTVGLPIILAWY